MNFRKIFPVISLVLLALAATAPARSWTTITGEHFEAEFVRVEGANGIFTVKEKDYPYPLNRLSAPDRLLIGRSVRQQTAVATPAAEDALTTPVPDASLAPATEKSAGAIELAGQPLKPGGSVEIELPIVDPAALREVRQAYGKPSSKEKVLLAVPDDFDPAHKMYPLLIVSATADGAASSIGTAFQYVKTALAKGFVVLAIDGEFGKPTAGDPPSFRWALVAAGRDALEKEWPGAKKWPVATAGVSGGGGYASFQALKLLQERANVIGLFLAVSPHNPTKFTSHVSSVPSAPLHQLPIFISAGDKDPTATPEITERSYKALVKDGFKNVRFEHFDGGHHLYQPHLEAALDWFLGATKSVQP